MRRHASDITVTDLFCGAGGSSLGAQQAGATLKLAMNHWQVAIETHNTNFPDAAHACADVSQCEPRAYPSTTILIASPECTNHSNAKGKRRNTKQMELLPNGALDPTAERSRATMWDVPRFAEVHRYELVIVENVVEAHEWEMFDAWLMAMHSLGYEHRLVFTNSMHTMAVPQSRDRMYGVFWRRGNLAPDLDFRPLAGCTSCGEVRAVQAWKRPDERWGKYRAQYRFACPSCAAVVEPYALPAAGAIDWSLKSQRIGDRERDLCEKTRARIAAGTAKHWASEPDPLLVNLDHPGTQGHAWPTSWPMPTHTARHVTSLLSPPLIAELRGGGSTARPVLDPLSTVTASGNHHALVMRNNSGGAEMLTPAGEPFRTSTTAGHQSLIEPPLLAQYNGNGKAMPVTLPMGTHSTRDRFGLVDRGRSVEVDDCYFRMLAPHEIGAAMAFPADYVVTGTKRDRVRQYGNAVTPPVMRMLVERCIATLR